MGILGWEVILPGDRCAGISETILSNELSNNSANHYSGSKMSGREIIYLLRFES